MALSQRHIQRGDERGSGGVGGPSPEAKGMSASTVSRLKQQWSKEYESWCDSPLEDDQWVYVWVDGIHSGLRAEDTKLCALVVIGVNERGEKRFLAIEDGDRESTQSWREVLLKLKRRGMNAPQLAIGDGALGFWNAIDEIYPDTRHQRCWVHKTANVLNKVPKAMQVSVKKALQEIWMADSRQAANIAFDAFIETYEAKYPKTAECLLRDQHELLSFYDSLLNIGRVSGHPIRLNLHSLPSAIEPSGPKDVCRVQRCCT